MEGGLLSLKWNNHRSSFIHVLSSLRKKDSFCDVTLACEGKFYPSHKLVLSTCSEYFQDMFQHTQCKHPVIVLKDIHCEDLEALLNYMYLGEVNVLQEKLSTLIKAAECLKIKGLAVPDDPPKDAIGEKRSSGLDSAPDSKRRRTDTSKPFSKNLSKSTEHSYRPSTTSQDNNYSLNRSSDNEMTENYSFDNENSSTPIKNKGRESNFIKQEPPDTYPEAEDTKEGVLQSAHNSFMSPLPQDEASNTDVMGPSESQEIWGSESRSGDGYPSLDGGGDGGGEATNEDGTRNETEWKNARAAKKWSRGGGSGESRPPLSHWKIRASHTSPSDLASWLPFSTLMGVGSDCALSEGGSAVPSKYECSACSKTFDHKGNYRKHVRTHTGERPFECHLCQYSASQKGNLQAHVKRMHADHSTFIKTSNE